MKEHRSSTISDVARRAGVSKATVSAVINDKSTVSRSTREKVLSVIEELNYRPREFARHRLRPSNKKSIGLIIKEEDNPYYSEIISGVRSFADSRGYMLLVASSGGSAEIERDIIELMTAMSIDGIIITPVLNRETDLSYLFDLKRKNVPFVLLEGIRGIKAPLVDIDNVKASEDAVSFLINQGYSKILYFKGPAYSMHSEDRLEGVRRAFSVSNMALPSEHIIEAGAHLEDGYRTGLGLFFGATARLSPRRCLLQ